MFDTKQKTLIKRTTNVTKSKNASFVNAALKNSAETLSGNGSKKYSTTGNVFVDQFGMVGMYKQPRSFSDISKDCELTWAEDKLMSVIFAIYIRMITRQTKYMDGSETKTSQKGAEMKHEGIMRMLWLHFKDEDVFWKNIGLFISAGSWKDVFTMLSYDLVYHGWDNRKLNWDKFGNLILSALENKSTSELVKKYLPQIKSTNSCNTVESQADNIIGKWLCSLLYGNKGEQSGHTYKKYRKLKTSGTAHEWQKLISQRKFDRIEFDKIHGRALSLLVKSKFLFNQNLSDKYGEWIKSPETKDVKYTGFVHELFQNVNRGLTKNDELTINKQFDTLVKKAGDTEQTSLIVVRDTSGSMGCTATGTKMTCYDVAKALALYFSEFLKGEFENAWIEFNSDAKMHTWKGNTPVEKWKNDRSSYVGSTNFQSVIELFVRLKKQGISESEFPKGILCISDGMFNPSELDRTNVQSALDKLRKAGFSKEYINDFVIVLWNLQSSAYGNKAGKQFETYGDVPNVFYFSGYSASVVSFLTNKIKTASELFEEAMNQELLNRVEI